MRFGSKGHNLRLFKWRRKSIISRPRSALGHPIQDRGANIWTNLGWLWWCSIRLISSSKDQKLNAGTLSPRPGTRSQKNPLKLKRIWILRIVKFGLRNNKLLTSGKCRHKLSARNRVLSQLDILIRGNKNSKELMRLCSISRSRWPKNISKLLKLPSFIKSRRASGLSPSAISSFNLIDWASESWVGLLSPSGNGA